MSASEKLSIANTCGPLQNSAWQSVANPYPNQFSRDYWKFQPEREGEGYVASFFPDAVQSDNYFKDDEGYNNIKNGMFREVTEDMPIFGNVKYWQNANEASRTWSVPYEQQKQTRVQGSTSAFRNMWKNSALYPKNRGKPDYLNFEGSLANM